MQKTTINLASLVEEVIEEVDRRESGPPTLWTLGDLPSIRGDAAMLRVALNHLISNALKFSSRRSKRKIEIGADQPADGSVAFYVRDNGVGFNMQQAGRLFGVFQRLHSQQSFAGAGVGLAIVRQVIQKHGGRTWATGAVDEGATFYFNLPFEGTKESML